MTRLENQITESESLPKNESGNSTMTVTTATTTFRMESLCKAALTLAEMSALSREVDLNGIAVMESKKERMETITVKVIQWAESDLRNGMKQSVS
jgi:hypothetical protein